MLSSYFAKCPLVSVWHLFFLMIGKRLYIWGENATLVLLGPSYQGNTGVFLLSPAPVVCVYI